MPNKRTQRHWLEGTGDADIDRQAKQRCRAKSGCGGCDRHWRPCGDCWLGAIGDVTLSKFREEYAARIAASRSNTPQETRHGEG